MARSELPQPKPQHERTFTREGAHVLNVKRTRPVETAMKAVLSFILGVMCGALGFAWIVGDL